MANRKVTIWKSIRLGDQWRYVRPVVGKNNKIIPNLVHVNGHQELHEEGQYFLHYLQGKKQVWAKCGPTPATAVEMAERQESLLRAVASGIALQPEFRTPLLLRDALYGYLEEYRLSQRPEPRAPRRPHVIFLSRQDQVTGQQSRIGTRGPIPHQLAPAPRV